MGRNSACPFIRLKRFEGKLKGLEDQLGSEGQLKVSEDQPEGPEGQLEGSEGLPKGFEGRP